MSRSKVTILSKYVMALAILALLFSVAITTSRYALEQSGSSTVGIESFDVDVKLYNSDGTEITDGIPDVTTDDLASYSGTYYLDVINNDSEVLYYKIEETSNYFIFKVDSGETYYSTYAGSVSASTNVILTLTVSASPSAKEDIPSGEYYKLPIKFYAEYQHGEEYQSVTVEVSEPEPSPEPEEPTDTNHSSTEWNYLTNSNASGATLGTAGNYCLTEDVELTASLTISNNVTLCLNGHTLSAASSYTLSQLINITGGTVTIEDCQSAGFINGGSSTQAINLDGSNTTLNLTSASISGGTNNVTISNSATLNLNGATLSSSCVTRAVYITSGTFNMSLGTINGNSQTGVYVGSGTTFNMYGGTITGAYKGINATSGSTVNISGGTIASCSSYGVDLVNGATLTLSGSPVISGNSTANVYLESGALVTLGELSEGANVGVTSATSITDSSSVQITSTETDTYNYESAIKYIHADNSEYKVSMNHASNGYLTLMSKDYVNVSVAIHYTNGSTYSNSIYLNGDSAAYMTDYLTLSSYSGTYAYNTYVQYGVWSSSADFNFVISANTDNMWYSGFAKTDNFSITWSESNYNLWNNQYYWNSESDNGNAVWGCSLSSLTSGVMSSIGDFVIVLELASTAISNSNSNTNNIVSNAYFVVDGVQQNLVS